MDSIITARPAARAFFFAALFSAALLAGGRVARAQSAGETPLTSSKLTPGGLQAGSPAGSYPLSGFDNVNLFNGNLNVRLPLLAVGGRGAAGYTMTLAANTKTWQVKFEAGNDTNLDAGGRSPGPIADSYTPLWRRWNNLSAGYGPGVMQGRSTGVGTVVRKTVDTGVVICARATPMYRHTLTRLTFVAPDGAEYELRDAETGGKPMPTEQARCNDTSNVGAGRGRRFVSADGSAMTFVAGGDIHDKVNVNSSGTWLFNPSGTLYMPDGTRYAIEEGLVELIRDRNGNQVSFAYTILPNRSGSHVSEITDALGRKITVQYDQTEATYGLHDLITYHGFGGAPRHIRVSKAALGDADVLRQPYSLQTPMQLFEGKLNGADYTGQFNPPEVVSAVWLPDGRKYKFLYNSYAEVARVELPTGGAYEYDMRPGAGVIVSSGATESGSEERHIYRRLKERRTYSGDTPDTLVAKDVYTTGDGVLESDSTVQVERYDKDGTRLSLSKHYFQGSAAQSLFTLIQGRLYSPKGEGKEFSTDALDTADGTTVLRSVTNTWVQREPVAWVSQIGSWGSNYVLPGLSVEPDNDPRLTRVVTMLETNEVSQQEFSYDLYNNQTEVKEYGYGAGAPGALLRRAVTEYLTTNPVGGADYVNVGASSDIHLRGLPLKLTVYAGASTTPLAQTGYEYDNYASDAGHAALTSRASATGLATVGPHRGNLTATTGYLLDAQGAVTGSVTSYLQYDAIGNVVKTVDARGYASTVKYEDRFGLPDAEAREHRQPADIQGLSTFAFPTKVTNALGHVAYTQYDYPSGLVVNTEDANGTVGLIRYDDLLDRLTQAVRAENVPALRAQTTFAYDAAGRKVVTTSDQSAFGDNLLKGEALYDGLGRTVESRQYETATQYVATRQKYDALGRAAEVSNPFRPLAVPAEAEVWTKTVYDALGRTVSVETPDGAKVRMAYDGARVLVTDQAGKQRLSVTDALGRLSEVWEVRGADAATGTEEVSFPVPQGVPAVSAGYRTSYKYDALGNLRTVEQGAQRRHFHYDSLGRLLRAKNPEQDARPGLALPASMLQSATDHNEWSLAYEYDGGGNLRQREDALGRVTEYVYDALGRVTNRNYTGETPDVTYVYELAGVANSAGRLTSVSSSVSVTRYTEYDKLGRVRASEQETAGQPAYAMAYDYYLDGALKSQRYPSGRVVATEYDGAGRFAGVKDAATGHYWAGGAPNPAKPSAAPAVYAPHGALTGLRLGNGLWERTGFNRRLQPTAITLDDQRKSPPDLKALELRYSYGVVVDGVLDPTRNNGNVESQTVIIPNAADPRNDLLRVTQAYEYDALNRLERAREVRAATGAEVWRQAYDYDRFGNRELAGDTTMPAVASLTAEAKKIYDPEISADTNRLEVGQGYVYDASGNMKEGHTSAGWFAFTYDAEGRTATADGAGEYDLSRYSYDGDGRRVKKATGLNGPAATGSQTVFVYDAFGKLVAEYASAPAPPQQGGGTQYLTSDHLGSPRVVTDAAGNVRARHDYLPFGEEVGAGVGGRTTGQGYVADNVRQKFTGHERDGETGLDYMKARYYSSTQGRFTSVDPGAFSKRHVANPQKWNRYPYVLNNPLKFFDPDGMEEIELIIRTFIPQKRITLPMPLKGDGRDVGERGTSRTEFRIKVETDIRKNNGDIFVGTPKARAGLSKGVTVKPLVVPGQGVIPVPGYGKSQVTQADIDKGTEATANRPLKDTVQVTATHAVAYPGVGSTPTIDYNFNLTVVDNNGRITVSAEGMHDGFPAIEIFAVRQGSNQEQLINSYDPRDTGQSGFELIGKPDTKLERRTRELDPVRRQ